MRRCSSRGMGLGDEVHGFSRRNQARPLLTLTGRTVEGQRVGMTRGVE